MIPLMMGVVAGRNEHRPSIASAAALSVVFVMGLAITFTIMGIAAALAGRIYGDISSVWNYVVALVCIVMGLHLSGVITVPIPALGANALPRRAGALGALILGMLFGLVSAPCAAPILIVLLTYLSGAGASLLWGAMLLLTYALGHSVLIVVAGTSMGAARVLLENKRAVRPLAVLRRGAGLIVVCVGFYFAKQGLK
jgi:cytochrome c-type biogenesis protein